MIAVRFASPVDFCRPNGSAHNSIRKTSPARPAGALTDVMKTSLCVPARLLHLLLLPTSLSDYTAAGAPDQIMSKPQCGRRLFFGGIISVPAGQKSRRRTRFICLKKLTGHCSTWIGESEVVRFVPAVSDKNLFRLAGRLFFSQETSFFKTSLKTWTRTQISVNFKIKLTRHWPQT